RAQAWYKGAVLAANGVFLALVALVGGRLAVQGDITVGELVAAVGLAQYLIGPLKVFSWFTERLVQGRASAERIAAVLSAPPAVTPGTRTLSDPIRGEIRLRGVQEGTLAGLDLTVRAGELLGVVAQPADATSLLRCLSRDIDPVAGRVELDGLPLTDLDPADVRSAILVVTHHATLFEDSLADNIRAAAPAGADIDAAMRAAQADEVARALPNGTASMVSDAGRSLSGGQRQRVVLARALAVDPPVLVLHDPTTAIDAVTEARIAAGIRELRRGRTTILVTTSPTLLAATDRVVTLEDGVTTAEGAHAHLVRSLESYRQAVLA
ncbi:MAG: ABC transporter ATP-binding protein/permease, partial [Actinomycetota bacterium]|nr:ABC transporter ATP-binding protein/permease [Actinomycetota bacterium]